MTVFKTVMTDCKTQTINRQMFEDQQKTYLKAQAQLASLSAVEKAILHFEQRLSFAYGQGAAASKQEIRERDPAFVLIDEISRLRKALQEIAGPHEEYVTENPDLGRGYDMAIDSMSAIARKALSK